MNVLQTLRKHNDRFGINHWLHIILLIFRFPFYFVGTLLPYTGLSITRFLQSISRTLKCSWRRLYHCWRALTWIQKTIISRELLRTINQKQAFRPGVSKLRLAGQNRPEKPFCQ